MSASGPRLAPAASDDLYRHVLMQLPEGVVIQDASGAIIACNASAERILGLSCDQMLGRTSVDPRWRAIHEDGSPFPGETHPAMVTLRTSRPQSGVVMGVHKPDGTLTWIMIDSHPLVPVQGAAPHGVFTVFRDITERLVTRQVLGQSEERYQTFLALSPDGISVTDNTGRILACNRQFAAMHGYEHSEEMIGRYAQEFARPAAFERLQREVAAALAAGEGAARHIEVEVFRRDGTPLITEYSVAQVPWPEAPSGVTYLSIIRDVTRQKQLLAELEQHRTNLAEQVRQRTSALEAEIAERATAQAALEQNQARLAEAGRIAHLGGWERDLAKGMLFFSDETHRIFGIDPGTPPEQIQRHFWNALHPDDYRAVEAAYANTLQTGEPLDTTYRIIRPGGEVRVVHARAEVMRDAAGRPQRVRGTVQDVTEQEQIKAALDQRIQELSILQDLGQPVSLKHTLEETIHIYLGRIVALSRFDMARVFLLHGDDLESASANPAGPVAAFSPCPEGSGARAPAEGECLCGLTLHHRQAVYAPDIEQDARYTRDCCRADSVRSVIALPLRSGETMIGVLALGAAAPHAFAGRLDFMQTIADLLGVRLHNALMHQRLQERAAGLEEAVAQRVRELQTERDRTQAILETVGESVIVTDVDGQVLYMNPATTALTGLSRDELLGQFIWSSWAAEAIAETWPRAQEALVAGQGWRGEVVGRRKDGAAYVAALTGSPLYDAGNPAAPVGAVWVQRDITLLKEAERLKDQFVSNVSHQLRTPISILALSCDNLDAFHDRLDEGQRLAIVRDIREQARVLTSLIEDTLKISQIDSRRIPEKKSRVDLARVVREETEQLAPIAARQSRQLVVVAPSPVYVPGHRLQLRQIVRNLLDNAIKYTGEGGRIRCTCEIRRAPACDTADATRLEGEARAVVEVADDGIGIPPEALPFLFTRFYRVHTESEIPGTGLGLAIARELVQLHGGRITVASAPGKGSTFTVCLPLWHGEGDDVG